MSFSPFHNNILATAGSDATVKVWKIPNEGIQVKETKEYVANLTGHYKKILH